jgi:hypothetical protein
LSPNGGTSNREQAVWMKRDGSRHRTVMSSSMPIHRVAKE